LILAAPRPKVLKRLWPQLAALGAGRIVILNAFKVEKCYFSSQWIDPAYYTPLLIEGLMQAGTTRLPEVQIKQRFKPFMEDELDGCFPNALRLLAHPGEAGGHGWNLADGQRPLLAVGPEGGWTDYELDMFLTRGFTPFSLGSRPLRTDTATIALISVMQERLKNMR
jgi:RsmE family RNA methyltransferase